MSISWIKMRADLCGDPAVISISFAVRISADHVVGKLHKLWSWADQNSADGLLPGVPAKWIDAFLKKPGFAAAMAKAGWLIVDEAGVTIPKFDRHNGASAKSRAQANARMKSLRSGSNNCCASSATNSEPRQTEKNCLF